MRTSLGQYRQSLPQLQGLVITVIVATPDAVRRGFICSAAMSARSSASFSPHAATVSGERFFSAK